ncbi:gluconokinase, partial [Bifidobacterium sp. M0353]|nr:gluconokinase [Bifidobacterium sp. M0353]
MTEKKNIFIFMGVSGSGKSVVAKQIADNLNAAFLDGD